jgi:four helix bundle protein
MKHFVYGFEKLDVWHDARQLTQDVYIISRSFPEEEKFGLVSQVRRAVVSVSSNLAEGSGRTGNKDQAHFTQLAYGSLMEVTNLLILASDLGYISNNEYDQLRAKIKKMSNRLNALRKSQLSRSPNKPIIK